MKSSLLLAAFISGISALLPGFSSEEEDFIKHNAPSDLLKAYEELTTEDKILLYQQAISGDLLTTMLTENERIVHLSSVVVKEIGNKIANLEGKAKKFVIKSVHNLLSLGQKMASGEQLNLKHLAEQETKRFRGLSVDEKKAIQDQFPILTSFGLFTNERLGKIMENLAAESLKAKKEL